MQNIKKYFTLLSLSLIVYSCTKHKPIPWDGPILIHPRNQLTVEELSSDSTFDLMDMSFFAKPEWAQKASHDLSGSISFIDTKLNFPKQREPYAGEDVFPGFSIDFISHEGELVPLIKEHIFTRYQSESYWDVLVGTGAVWQEEEDEEWSRASFPLSLTDRYMGQVINCVATFVYSQQEISNVCLQCSQESAHLEYGQINDFRATLVAKYNPKSYSDSTELISRHLQFRSLRLPVYPLTAIDVNQEIAENFDAYKYTNAPVSLGAVWLNEKLYLHPPKTRHGLYPYPGEMRHGINSATKSMAGSLSLLYFAERYGDTIFDEFITDYVPVLADHTGWQGVTFSHALNMVTGTVGSEKSEHFGEILVMPRTAEECINNIATLGDAPGAPGEKFNYGPTNTFVLSYALQKYVEKKEGKKIGYWDLVRENVLVPIGANYFSVRQTIEPNGQKGIPLLSYGAFPTLDEAAKIAILLENEGNYQGQQLLHKEKTREALGRASCAAHSTDDSILGSKYQHGFWSKSIRTEKCNIDVTYMLGYGENYVLFLPSKAIIFRFMDEHDLDISDLVQNVERIKPSCQKE